MTGKSQVYSLKERNNCISHKGISALISPVPGPRPTALGCQFNTPPGVVLQEQYYAIGHRHAMIGYTGFLWCMTDMHSHRTYAKCADDLHGCTASAR